MYNKITNEHILKKLNIIEYYFCYENTYKIDIVISEYIFNEFACINNTIDIQNSLLTNNSEFYKFISTNTELTSYIYSIVYTNINNIIKCKGYEVLCSHIIFYSFIESFFISFDKQNIEFIYIDTCINKYKLFTIFGKNINIFYIILDKHNLNVLLDRKNNILMAYIYLFIKSNILFTKTILSKNKSLVFYKIIGASILFRSKIKYSISLPKTIVYKDNLYTIENCIYTIVNTTKQNPKSKSISTINTSAVDITNTIPIYIDHNLLKTITSEFYSNFFIKTNDDCLKHKNGTYILEQIDLIKKISSSVYKTGTYDNKNKKTLLRNASRLLSTYISIHQFMGFIEFSKQIKNNAFYLTHYLDFRGRLYSTSSLSPIYYKYVRSVYFLGYYSNTELDNIEVSTIKTTAYSILKKYFYTIDDVICANTRPLIKQAIIWILIDIAKITKSKFLKNSSTVHILEFIEHGKNMYFYYKDNHMLNLDFDDRLEMHKLIYVLNQILNNNINYKYYLNKDSTASGMQHLLKYLGIKNTTSLNICNLDGVDTWTDPYTVILENFIRTHTVSNKCIRYFTRSNLKKVIMAYNYSLSQFGGLKYFYETLWDDINKLNVDEREDFIKSVNFEYKKFFKYLENDFEVNLLYELNSSKLILLENKNITFLDGSSVNLLYNKASKPEREAFIKNEKVRLYFTDYLLLETVDVKKTNIAFVANLIQATDSLFARMFISRMPVLTIHDCFSIPGLETCIAIDIFNELFKEKILACDLLPLKNYHLLDNTYNIFIVL